MAYTRKTTIIRQGKKTRSQVEPPVRAIGDIRLKKGDFTEYRTPNKG